MSEQEREREREGESAKVICPMCRKLLPCQSYCSLALFTFFNPSVTFPVKVRSYRDTFPRLEKAARGDSRGNSSGKRDLFSPGSPGLNEIRGYGYCINSFSKWLHHDFEIIFYGLWKIGKKFILNDFPSFFLTL